jgi:hypothetical protein
MTCPNCQGSFEVRVGECPERRSGVWCTEAVFMAINKTPVFVKHSSVISTDGKRIRV